MRTNILYISAITLLLLSSCISKEQKEINKIKKQYVNSLIGGNRNSNLLVEILEKQLPEKEVSDQVVVDVQKRYPLDTLQLNEYLSTFDETGFWKDINYADTKRSGWEPKLHADRLLVITKFYVTSDSPYYQDEKLGSYIHKALDYWFEKKFVCSNWWYNEIGVPKTMGEVFMLLENNLSDDEKQSAIELMINSQIGMTGQNRVWLTGNVLVRAMLENNYELIKECRDVIMAEVVNNKEEGIKADWSFHQHGPMLQFGNYGLSYIMSMAFYANLFDGTTISFTDDKLDILADYLGQGFRWTLWKGYMDVNALARQLFKNSQRDKAMGLGFAAADMSECDHVKCKVTAESIINDNFINKDNPTTFIGHKHFHLSDYTVHRSSDWMASLKMSSKRVIGTELVNEDNLKGYYLGDGALYVYIDGDEYLNIMPFWNWRKIPGITGWDLADNEMPKMKDTKNNRSSFAGGISLGNTGASVMQLDRDSLMANKAWIMEDDFILCLGSGITSKEKNNVMTSIDQRFKKDNVLVYNGNSWTAVPDGIITLKPSRLYHDKMGYICCNTIKTIIGNSKGSWSDPMGLYSYKEEETSMLTIQIDHGVSPKDASYAYFILPNKSIQEVENFDTERINIIENSKKAQIINIGKHKAYVIAYTGLKTKVLGDIDFYCRNPGIYVISKNKENVDVRAADPLYKLSTLDVTVNGNNKKIECETLYTY